MRERGGEERGVAWFDLAEL